MEHADGRRGDYTLKRDKINLDSEAASSSVVPSADKSAPKLGYLRLQSFYVSAPTGKDDKPRSSCEDMAERLRELAKAKVDGVLLDLRGNGGGSLHDAVRIIGLFVRSGPAVQLTTAAGTVPVDVVPDETVCDTPVVVLVDGLSASASELVSGTLQDLGRAVVAGDVQTVGKGTAQTSVDLAETDNGGEGTILVTNGKFYRVTGSSTQFKGVASDIVLPSASPDSIREEDLDYPLPWDEIGRAPHEKAWDLDKFIPEREEQGLEEARAHDPPLREVQEAQGEVPRDQHEAEAARRGEDPEGECPASFGLRLQAREAQGRPGARRGAEHPRRPGPPQRRTEAPGREGAGRAGERRPLRLARRLTCLQALPASIRFGAGDG